MLLSIQIRPLIHVIYPKMISHSLCLTCKEPQKNRTQIPSKLKDALFRMKIQRSKIQSNALDRIDIRKSMELNINGESALRDGV